MTLTEFAETNKLPVVIPMEEDIPGNGVLIQISKSSARVWYDGVEKKYNLPADLDKFVLKDKRDDARIRSSYEQYEKRNGLTLENDNYKKYVTTKYFKPLSNESVLFDMKQQFPKKRTLNNGKKNSRMATCGFFGINAQDIEFTDARDAVVAMAFLASPGRANIEADVPPQYFEAFKEAFPHANFTHTNSRPNTCCQFVIKVYDTTNIPQSLASSVIPADVDKLENSSETVRICRSAYAFDLVDTRGFMFGAEQDTNAIRDKVPDDMKYIFDTYLEEFSIDKEMER